jgi:hypothetical protein
LDLEFYFGENYFPLVSNSVEVHVNEYDEDNYTTTTIIISV